MTAKDHTIDAAFNAAITVFHKGDLT